MLHELISTIMEFLDVGSYIVSRMALVLNIESLVLYLLNNMCDHMITIAEEHSIIDVNDESDVILVKYTLVNKGLYEPNFT